MVLGLILYLEAGPWLPEDDRAGAAGGFCGRDQLSRHAGRSGSYCGLAAPAGPVGSGDRRGRHVGPGRLAWRGRAGVQPGDRPRLIALLLLIPVLAVAMLVNQQIFNAYLVWADAKFQLTSSGTTLPTSWMITIDAPLSVSMLVAVALFWKWRAHGA